MKKGEQIDRFGTAVRSRVEDVRRSLPIDLVIGTTSDHKRQVREKLDLFNRSLSEAVVLVVFVSRRRRPVYLQPARNDCLLSGGVPPHAEGGANFYEA